MLRKCFKLRSQIPLQNHSPFRSGPGKPTISGVRELSGKQFPNCAFFFSLSLSLSPSLSLCLFLPLKIYDISRNCLSLSEADLSTLSLSLCLSLSLSISLSLSPSLLLSLLLLCSYYCPPKISSYDVCFLFYGFLGRVFFLESFFFFFFFLSLPCRLSAAHPLNMNLADGRKPPL